MKNETMATQVTINLTEDQRIAVGLMETGRMVEASRDEVRSFVTQVIAATVNTATAIVNEKREETKNLITASIEREKPSE